MTELLVRGASTGKTLADEIDWDVDMDEAGLYSVDDGYVIAVPKSDGEYFYSEVTVDREDVA